MENLQPQFLFWGQCKKLQLLMCVSTLDAEKFIGKKAEKYQ